MFLYVLRRDAVGLYAAPSVEQYQFRLRSCLQHSKYRNRGRARFSLWLRTRGAWRLVYAGLFGGGGLCR